MKLQTITTNFSAGELSPRLMGRTDLEKYNSGAKTLRNVVALREGGITARPSRRYVQAAGSHNTQSRLIPFVRGVDPGYAVEFSSVNARFFKAGAALMSGGSQVTANHPYSASELLDLEHAQSADTLIICHPDHMPRRLVRQADDQWLSEGVAFDPGPLAEVGHWSTSQAMTLSVYGTGSMAGSATVASGDFEFRPADVGRQITSGLGTANIIGYTSATQVDQRPIRSFTSGALAAGTWRLEGTPRATVTPSAAGPVGQSVTLSTGGIVYAGAVSIVSISWAAGTVTVDTANPHGLTTGRSVYVTGCAPTGYNGTFTATVTGLYHFTYPLASDPGSITVPGTTQDIVSTPLEAFRDLDVGKYVEINGGLLRIDTYSIPSSVGCTVIQELEGTTSAPPDSWTLTGPAWNEMDGYPRACAFHQGRLWFGGTSRWPQTVWGSQSGLPFSFLLGADDSAAVAKTIDSDRVTEITHMTTAPGVLLVFTAGGEFSITGGIEKPLTQSNAQITPLSRWGSDSARPVAAGRNVLFAQRGGRDLREAYQGQYGAIDTRDISIWSRHLVADGISAMAWEQGPEGVMWIVTDAGDLLAMTYSDEQQQQTWCGGDHQGVVESIVSVPNGSSDLTYAQTRYTINGATKRYIEVLDWEINPGQDCRTLLTSGTATTSWSGLSHLAACDVSILADGVYIGTGTVTTGGGLTISRPALSISVGLPYTPRVVLAAPEVASQGGTTQGQQLSTHEIMVRFLDTASCTVNGEPVPFRSFDTASTLDNAPPTFTGKVAVGGLGWAKGESDITISQPYPYPWTVLAVIRSLSANQG